MLSAKEQQVCDSIRARERGMVEDLRAHVAIPTGYNHSAGLDDYRGVVTRRLKALGAGVRMAAGVARPEWIGHEGMGEAIPGVAVCERCEGKHGTKVLLAGHLDTVFDPTGSFLEMQESADGKTAIGPGVVDMKGGILVALVALEALEAAGIDGAWTFVLNSDEEMGTFMSEHVLREEAAKHEVGIALEPALPGGELAIDRRGSGQFFVEVFGKSAHAGRAFADGVSAVYGLARVMNEIEKMSDLPRGLTLNIGPIKGGIATNIVPEYAAAWGNIRYPDRETADEVGARLDALSTEDGSLPKVVVQRVFNRPAKPMTAAVERLGLAARGAAESLGQQLPFAKTGGVCDGNILQDAGLATIDTLGVRGGGLHTEEEWVDLSSLVERAQLLAVLLMRVWDGRAALGEGTG